MSKIRTAHASVRPRRIVRADCRGWRVWKTSKNPKVLAGKRYDASFVTNTTVSGAISDVLNVIGVHFTEAAHIP